MSASIAIGARKVGLGSPCFVIAEAGVNHNGDLGLAHELVEIAAGCGADAVKFQTFDPSGLVSQDAAPAPYQAARGAASQTEMLEALTLPEKGWIELAAHAREVGITFLSTAFDRRSLELLLAVGVEVLKSPSGELDNIEYLSHLASAGLPVIVSTGLGTMDEVAAAVEATGLAPGIALLHCVTAYPAPLPASNLRAMSTMAEAFDVPVGWSDHTVGPVTSVVAVGLGASILEKHITADRAHLGPDHAASEDPPSFAEYVRSVREAEAALGDGVKRPAEVELQNLVFARRSYHARRDLQAGESLSERDVVLLRPATGIPPSVAVVGRAVARAVPAGRALVPEDLA